MSHFLAGVLLLSLLLPNGINFFTTSTIDFPYAEITAKESQAPLRLANNSFGLETSADSLVVFDDASDTMLYSKNPGVVMPIASVTKLLTALVFLDTKPNWDATITITKDDLRSGGTIRLIPGEIVSVKDLFTVMLVASSNEAAIALARTSGLSDFAKAMNQKAKELGMWESYFVEPSGLNSRNVSRPVDLIKLANTAFAQPEIITALTHDSYTFTAVNTKRQGTVTNTDKLLESFLNNNKDYTIVGAKTGYLDEAGYCLLIKVKKVNGPTITLVILGADSAVDRWQEAKGLVDWVFSNYRWKVIENSTK